MPTIMEALGGKNGETIMEVLGGNGGETIAEVIEDKGIAPAASSEEVTEEPVVDGE